MLHFLYVQISSSDALRRVSRGVLRITDGGFLGLLSPPSTPLFADSILLIRRKKRLSLKHFIVTNRSRWSWSPRESPDLVGEKLTLYIGVWLYYATFSRAPGAKARTRNRRLQNFIVCHAEINNKTDFISYDLYIISFSLKAREYLSCRAQVCVYMCKWACMYELRAYFY